MYFVHRKSIRVMRRGELVRVSEDEYGFNRLVFREAEQVADEFL